MTRARIVNTCSDATVAILAAIAAATITSMLLVDSHDDHQLDHSRKPAMVEKR